MSKLGGGGGGQDQCVPMWTVTDQWYHWRGITKGWIVYLLLNCMIWMIKLFKHWEQIRLLNSKTNDLDWYYSRHNQKLGFLISDLLFTPFVKNHSEKFTHTQVAFLVDLKKTMAVLLDNIMERLEKLERQVNNSTLARQSLSNQIDVVSIIVVKNDRN